MIVLLRNRVLALLGRITSALVGASLVLVGKEREPLPPVVSTRLTGLHGNWFVLAPAGPGAGTPERVRVTAVNPQDGRVDLAPPVTEPAPKGTPVAPTSWMPFCTEAARWHLATNAAPLPDDCRVAWVADDRAQIILARSRRDVLWLLSRQAALSDAQRQKATDYIRELGYPSSALDN